jgi:5,10-methylene-tetrahydrofolate dehydrogenase/methenyl tetrahydrofolate cyclohydrolase
MVNDEEVMNHKDEMLDTSWIEEYENEEKYYTMFYPEKAVEIKANMMYVNKDNNLEKMGENVIYLSIPGKITRNELVKLIKDNNRLDQIRYKLSGIQIYNIDLKHNDIKHFISNPNKYDFIKELRNIDDYELVPTINCLQMLNNICILFTEDTRTNNNKNQTKRVTFSIDTKKTRKKR